MRLLLLLTLVCAGLLLAADPFEDAFSSVNAVADSLTQQNPADFLARFQLPEKDQSELRGNVTALIAQAEVSSSIEVITHEGDEQVQKLEVDWIVSIRSRVEGGASTQRREVARMELRKVKGHWVIVKFQPIPMFRPA